MNATTLPSPLTVLKSRGVWPPPAVEKLTCPASGPSGTAGKPSSTVVSTGTAPAGAAVVSATSSVIKSPSGAPIRWIGRPYRLDHMECRSVRPGV